MFNSISIFFLALCTARSVRQKSFFIFDFAPLQKLVFWPYLKLTCLAAVRLILFVFWVVYLHPPPSLHFLVTLFSPLLSVANPTPSYLSCFHVCIFLYLIVFSCIPSIFSGFHFGFVLSPRAPISYFF